AWAGSITTVLTLAAAIAALPLARLAETRGRRTGLVTGLVAAMMGALLIIASVVGQSFVLLLMLLWSSNCGLRGRLPGAELVQ
ncbi:MAG: MFS transporter, partial [Paenarthrobacter sp.]